jgi:hypothetical protein
MLLYFKFAQFFLNARTRGAGWKMIKFNNYYDSFPICYCSSSGLSMREKICPIYFSHAAHKAHKERKREKFWVNNKITPVFLSFIYHPKKNWETFLRHMAFPTGFKLPAVNNACIGTPRAFSLWKIFPFSREKNFFYIPEVEIFTGNRSRRWIKFILYCARRESERKSPQKRLSKSARAFRFSLS